MGRNYESKMNNARKVMFWGLAILDCALVANVLATLAGALI